LNCLRRHSGYYPGLRSSTQPQLLWGLSFLSMHPVAVHAVCFNPVFLHMKCAEPEVLARPGASAFYKVLIRLVLLGLKSDALTFQV